MRLVETHELTKRYDQVTALAACSFHVEQGEVFAAADAAKAAKLDGKWLFTLQAPSYGPFMQYAADRALRKQGLGTVPVLQVIDEVLFDVPEAELHEAAALCANAMRHSFELEVPLKVGVEAGKTWADLQPVALAGA